MTKKCKYAIIVNMIVNTLHADTGEVWKVFFQVESATANIAILLDQPTTAFLYDVYSVDRGKGHARALMQEIDEYCKKRKIMLIVEADAFASDDNPEIMPSLDNEQLKNFYQSCGALFIEYDKDNGHPMLLMGSHQTPNLFKHFAFKIKTFFTHS